MQQKVRSAVLITRDNSILLIERVKAPKPMYYVLPGGGVEDGETPEQTAIREMKEELGMDIEVISKEKDPFQTDRETWIVRAELEGGAEPKWLEEHKQTPENSYKVVWMPMSELERAPVFPEGAVKLLTQQGAIMNKERFDRVRSDLIEVYPQDTPEPRLQYVRRNWIFPNHIDIAVDFARQLAEKYQANVEVAMLGALLHDAGLAYKRERADPAGHEDRSIEYAQESLPKYGYDRELIDEVVKCISATEPEVEPATLEAKIVRSADAMSHMLSVHYLAKTKFASDWESGISFVEKKIKKDFSKICLDDERELVRPIYEYFSKIVEQYRTGKVATLKEWAE